jgi:hypothetical protein
MSIRRPLSTSCGIYDALITHLRTIGPVHEDAVTVGVFLKHERKLAEVRPMARSLSVSGAAVSLPGRLVTLSRAGTSGRYHRGSGRGAMTNADPLERDDQASDNEGQLSVGDTLDDRGLDDALDEGYSPPENYRGSTAFGVTETEAEQGESLDERIRQEVPDQPLPSTGPLSRTDVDEEGVWSESDEFFDEDEVGDARAGRLAGPDEEDEPDGDQDWVGRDVGIDGGAASAEEAAVHIVEFP